MRGEFAFIALCAVAGAAWCDGARPLALMRGPWRPPSSATNPDVAKGWCCFEFIGHTTTFEVGGDQARAVASRTRGYTSSCGSKAWPSVASPGNPDLPSKALNIRGHRQPLFIRR